MHSLNQIWVKNIYCQPKLPQNLCISIIQNSLINIFLRIKKDGFELRYLRFLILEYIYHYNHTHRNKFWTIFLFSLISRHILTYLTYKGKLGNAVLCILYMIAWILKLSLYNRGGSTHREAWKPCFLSNYVSPEGWFKNYIF